MCNTLYWWSNVLGVTYLPVVWSTLGLDSLVWSRDLLLDTSRLDLRASEYKDLGSDGVFARLKKYLLAEALCHDP
jgi:hypothetical protein